MVVGLAARRMFVIVAHLVLWAAALVAAFLLRFEFRLPAQHAVQLVVWLPLVLIVRVAAFYAFDIFKATTLSTLVLTAVLVVFFQTFPRSVIAIDYMLALMLVGGVRFSIR